MIEGNVLLFTDLHLHTWRRFGYDVVTRLPRRLKEQYDILDQIESIRKERKIQRTIFGGDLFHKVGEIPVECLNIANAHKDLWDLMVPGNHDLIDREDPKWFQFSADIFRRSLEEQQIKDGIKLVGFSDKIDYDELKGYRILVLHRTPMGSQVGNYTFTDGVDWKRLMKNNKLVFFGHIHQKQQLGERAFVMGAPMHLNFGDIGERGCWIVDKFDNVEFVKLKYPEFRTVATWEDVDDKDTYNYYRVMQSELKSTQANVVAVSIPKTYNERLTSNTFTGILSEWLEINNRTEDLLLLLKPILTDKMQVFSSLIKGCVVKVSVKDFLSVGEAKYDLPNGFVLITGDNSEYFDSNGAGKTSLTGEAIFWALFEQTTKGLKGDDVIRRGQKDCMVRIAIQDGNSMVSITRSRKGGLKIVKDGEELFAGMKRTDMQKSLEEQILGFTASMFLASCYFSQESLTMLTSLSDTEKTSMISNLLGFEQYDDLYQKTADQIKRLAQDKVELVDTATQSKYRLSNLIEQKEKVFRDSKEIEEEMLEVINLIEMDEKNVFEVTQQIKSIDDSVFKGDPEDWDKQIDTIRADALKCRKKIAELNTKITETSKEVSAKVSEEAKLDILVRTVKRTSDELVTQIAKLESSQFGERCDKCGSVISEDNIGLFIKEKQVAIAKCNNEIVLYQEQSREVEKARLDIEAGMDKIDVKRDALNEHIDELRADENALLERKDAEDVARAEHQQRKSKVENELSRLLGSLESRRKHRTSLRERLIALDAEVKSYSDQISELEAKMVSYDENTQEIEKEINDLDFWRAAFSPKGIRALLLDRFCNEFNVIVNGYLSTVSNGTMSIWISPTKALKSGEERNKIGMEISMGESIVKYESLSGGEKRRVDVSLCLSLNRWVSIKYNIENGLLGLLILDELFSFVDRVGEESIGTLLQTEGQNKTVFVISHTPDLGSYSDHIWKVTKKNDISSLITEGGIYET